MSKQPEIPFALRHEMAENAIFNAVSESAKSVPFFLLEGILTNILHQVREQAKVERANAVATYNKQMEEYNKDNESAVDEE